jgi:hypothetical protein
MNTRRKFLFSGSMATAALLTAKPFTAVANSISPVTGFRFNNNSLVLAHTGNAVVSAGETLGHISKLKSKHTNLIMLHAADKAAVTGPVYDASLHAGEAFSVKENDYKIIYKGDIKTGVITAGHHSVTAESINALAKFLKQQKNCHLVVCLSQLGYTSASGLNDLDLAAASTHLDVIIGGHATNFCKRPVIMQNKNKEEVIINHAATNGLAMRLVEIGFDNRGKKSQVAFTRAC